MIDSFDIRVDLDTYVRVKTLEDAHIVWDDKDIKKQVDNIIKVNNLPSKYIPEAAKERNYVMSCFNLWSEYELYRFCQSAPVHMGETKKRATLE